MDGTVLIADDDRSIRTVLTQALTRAGCQVSATGSLATLMRWIEEGRGDVVISDVVMPDGNGLKTLPKILELRPDLPVLIISAQNTIMTAVQAEEANAWDYLPKPFDLPDLMARVGKALTAKGPVADVSAPAQDLPMIGQSQPMQDLYRLIARIARQDLPVLITGETGSGKTLAASVLHQLSGRTGQLVSLPIGADIQAGMTRATGGTLVVEDVADLSPEGQVALAQALDNPSARIISTVRGGLDGLRDDLYYRLSALTLHMPPLRERLDDLPLHLEQALDGHALTDDALDLLRRYNWPGNVRQLDHIAARLKALSPERLVGGETVSMALASEPKAQPVAMDEALSESIAAHLSRYFAMHGGELPLPGLYGRILREMELPLIEIALEATGGNQAKCADLLGINRNTLRKKITELGIQVTRRRKLM